MASTVTLRPVVCRKLVALVLLAKRVAMDASAVAARASGTETCAAMSTLAGVTERVTSRGETPASAAKVAARRSRVAVS